MIILGTNSIKDTGGYNVANSCRFNSGDSAYMHKTPSSAGSNSTFTFSAWVKRGTLSSLQMLFSAGSSTQGQICFDAQDNLAVYDGSTVIAETNAVYRDPSAWMHVVVACASGASGTDKCKVYVNGTQITSFATDNRSSFSNLNNVNQDSQQNVGAEGSGPTNFFDGYMAEVVMIDGTQYAASDFGEFDSSSPTIWKPKDPSGLTFGTNGFYLDFEDSSNLGNDANGGTDLTETNLDAADQTPDTCTNNFATLNPLGFAGTTPTFSQGNLNALCGSGVSLYSVPTIGVSSGKWYVEGELEQATPSSGVYYVDYGFHDRADTRGQSYYVSNGRMFWLSSWDGKINYRTGGSTTAGLVTGLATLTPGDFFQLYLDMDNELMYWGKNGSLLNSTGVSFNGKESLTGEYFFAFADQYSGSTTEYAVNFGQGSIDGSAVANFQDANGFGNFKYNPTVTTDEGSKDFLALCTKNLGSNGG